MRVGLFCRPHQLPGAAIESFMEVARVADDAGMHSIQLGEHVVMGPRPEKWFPFGPFSHEPDVPWLDPVVMLALAAGVTRRLRLSTGVLLAALRPGPVLAKQLATLDVISQGRAEIGLGVGWQREELAACGVEWSQRYARFDQVVRECRTLWSAASPTAFSFPGGDVEQMTALPVPVQPRLPLLLGLAPTPANIARIVEYADGWCPSRLSPEQLADGVQSLRTAFVAADRDPDSLIVRAHLPSTVDSAGGLDLQAASDAAHAYVRSGASVVVIDPTSSCPTMPELVRVIRQLGDLSTIA